MREAVRLPMIVRIAGLPVGTVEPFASGLLDVATRLENLEERLLLNRAELVNQLHPMIQTSSPDVRRLMLAMKRDSFNGRSLRKHRDQKQWPTLPEDLRQLAEEVIHLEGESQRLRLELETAYAERQEHERGVLLSYLENGYFLRGVALSSSVLVENLPRLRQRESEDSERRVKRLEQSLLRYVSRAALKLSPFSTLTRTGLASVIEDAGCQGLELIGQERWSERSTVSVQRFLPEQIADILVRCPPFHDRLRVSLNETLESRGADDFLFIRPGFWGPDPESLELRNNLPALVKLRLRGPLIDWIRERLARGPEIYLQLLADLQSAFPSSTEAVLRNTLSRLLEMGFLCWQRPWHAEDLRPEDRLLDHLRGAAADEGLTKIADSLARIIALLDGYVESDSPGSVLAEGKAIVKDLARQAAELGGIDPRFVSTPVREWFFHEDVFLESDLPPGDVARLSDAECKEALEDVAPLSRLSNLYNSRHDFLHALAAFASSRWADQGEVPFLELFDTAYPLFQDYVKFDIQMRSQGLMRGFAWNPSGIAAAEDLRGYREMVAKAVQECLAVGEDTLRLDRRALDQLLDEVPGPYAMVRDFSAFLQPTGQGDPRWVLNGFCDGAGRMSSRYTGAMSPALRDRFTALSIAQSHRNDGGEPYEVIDIFSPGGHTANVHLPQTQRVLVLPGHQVDLPPERKLTPSDLTVRLLGPDRFPVLVDRSGQRLSPVHLGAVAFRYLPSLSKFLALFGPNEMRMCAPRRKPRVEGDVEIAERHTIGKVVYRRKTWTFDPRELRAAVARQSPVAAFVTINRWRKDRMIPERVFLAEPIGGKPTNPYTKPQYIDFTSCSFTELFNAVLRRTASKLRLAEALPAPGQVPSRAGVAKLAAEVQLESFGFLDAPLGPFP